MTGNRTDYRAFVAGLLAAADVVNGTGCAIAGLQRLIDTVRGALGAASASFVEFGLDDGRIVATTESHSWALGWRVHHEFSALLINRCRELPVHDLPAEAARQLAGRGLRRLLAARAELRGQLVGSLQVYFADDDWRSTEDDRMVVAMTAAAAARLYSAGSGLPVYGEGPVSGGFADGLAILAPDGTVRAWNPAAQALTGTSMDEALGRPLPFACPPAGQAADLQLDGGRWLQVVCSRMTGTDTRVVTFRDITEAKLRTQAKDLFVAVTSHELRTPVTVIKGYAEMLAERWGRLDDTGRQDVVRVIGQRARELAGLVDRLLLGAWAETPNLRVPGEPFDMLDRLREAGEHLTGGLRGTLVLDLPEELPAASGDPTSVSTVFVELVTNARKYSPDGGKIELTAGADERTVYFRVADRGVGVRPEHAERAFERYWQADGGDQRRFSGVGLGLYLVRRIVERQGGWVSLRARDAGGTVAEVRLPRADAAGGEA